MALYFGAECKIPTWLTSTPSTVAPTTSTSATLYTTTSTIRTTTTTTLTTTTTRNPFDTRCNIDGFPKTAEEAQQQLDALTE